MTPKEQVDFINGLSARVLNDMVEAIQAGRVPSRWDGIDLRLWLSERFENCVIGATPKRKAEYKNDVIINDL